MTTLYCMTLAFEKIQSDPYIEKRLLYIGVSVELVEGLVSYTQKRPICGLSNNTLILVIEANTSRLSDGTKLEDWIESKEKLKYIEGL